MEIRLIKQLAQVSVNIDGVFSHDISWSELAMSETRWSQLRENAVHYGEALFDLAFPADSRARAVLDHANQSENAQRLVLTFSESALTFIPWEYLYHETFVAVRHHLLRGIDENKRQNWSFHQPDIRLYAIIAEPVLAHHQPIATQQAWSELIHVVQSCKHQAYLERIYPATIVELGKRLSQSTCNILHLLCHGELGDDGVGTIFLQDRFGREIEVTAIELLNVIRAKVGAVVLNSCSSARPGHSDLSNFANTLIQDGVPYALGMQAPIEESAAFAFSNMFYTQILQGNSIEEAVRLARTAILSEATLPESEWLVGIPALYTSLGEPSSALPIAIGQATISPDPSELRVRQRLEARPVARVLGRGEKLVETAEALLTPQDRRPNFITLQGFGGMGKTALAYEIVDQFAWAFDWRVFSISFEVLPADFRYLLIEFAILYLGRENVDPRWSDADLELKVIQEVKNRTSLVIVDGIENLLQSASDKQQEGRQSLAQQIITLLQHLSGGKSAILLCSREKTNWYGEKVIFIGGLSDSDGARLFRQRLNGTRQYDAVLPIARQLSGLVGGHPLSLKLLAAEFQRETCSLNAFVERITPALKAAKDSAPESLYDPNRHKTLETCITYTLDHLFEEQKQALTKLSIFQNPFEIGVGAGLLNNDLDLLSSLEERSLLELEWIPDENQPMKLMFLHPVLRWYIAETLPSPDAQVEALFGQLTLMLVKAAVLVYWEDAKWGKMLVLTEHDLERGGNYLKGHDRGVWAYHFAYLLGIRGQYHRALALLNESAQLDDELGFRKGAVMTRMQIAHNLSHMGQLEDALAIYQTALQRYIELGDSHGGKMARQAIAKTLRLLGRMGEATAIIEQSLSEPPITQPGELSDFDQTPAANFERALEAVEARLIPEQEQHHEIGDRVDSLLERGYIAKQRGYLQEALQYFRQAFAALEHHPTRFHLERTRTLKVMGATLLDLGQTQEGLNLTQEALAEYRAMNNFAAASVTLADLGHAYLTLGEFLKANEAYEEALKMARQINDLGAIELALTGKGHTLRALGHKGEAVNFYQQALEFAQQSGEPRSIAHGRFALAATQADLGDHTLALTGFQDVLKLFEALDDRLMITQTRFQIAELLVISGDYASALEMAKLCMETFQTIGLRRYVQLTFDLEARIYEEQGDLAQALMLYKRGLEIAHELNDKNGIAITQRHIAGVLKTLDRPEDALDAYRETLTLARKLGNIQFMHETLILYTSLLFEQQEYILAIHDAWHARENLIRHKVGGTGIDAWDQILAIMRDTMPLREFDNLWRQITQTDVPQWLLKRTNQPITLVLKPEEVETIVSETINVMKAIPDERRKWKTSLTDLLKQVHAIPAEAEINFLTAVVSWIEGKPATLSSDSPYASAWHTIQEKAIIPDVPFPEEVMVRLIGQAIGAAVSGGKQREDYIQTLEEVLRNEEGAEAIFITALLELLKGNPSALPEGGQRYVIEYGKVQVGIEAERTIRAYSPPIDLHKIVNRTIETATRHRRDRDAVKTDLRNGLRTLKSMRNTDHEVEFFDSLIKLLNGVKKQMRLKNRYAGVLSKIILVINAFEASHLPQA